MKRILPAVLTIIVTLLISFTPVLAAPPPDNPGKGHPKFERYVFVHYADNSAKKSGGGGSAPQLYSYSGYHWKNNTVPYWFNRAGNRISDADAINGITASFQTWQNDPNSRITFSYQGTARIAPGLNASKPDYQNVVGWAYLSDNYPRAIAMTVVWAARGNKLIFDSDTVLNTDVFFAWTQANITPDPNTAVLPSTAAYDVDVQNIMTHEAGHWLQLNDLYGLVAAGQTMCGISSDGELKKRNLESGDLAGVKIIYP